MESRQAEAEERYPEAKSAAEQWQRVVLNQAVDEHIAGLGPERRRAAEISGKNHSGKGWLSHESLDYPEFDICAPVERSGEFDVVICEQVLEHVLDPFAGARNLGELCRPGGNVIVSTPFMIKVHELAIFGMLDYWRFTPRGLRRLLEQGGLEVDEIGSWGNRECLMHEIDHWTAYRPWHSLEAEEDAVVQVWAFARRPG